MFDEMKRKLVFPWAVLLFGRPFLFKKVVLLLKVVEVYFA